MLRDRWQTHIDAALSRPVLIVDEAQEMPPAVLAELRLLSSARLDSHHRAHRPARSGCRPPQRAAGERAIWSIAREVQRAAFYKQVDLTPGVVGPATAALLDRASSCPRIVIFMRELQEQEHSHQSGLFANRSSGAE